MMRIAPTESCRRCGDSDSSYLCKPCSETINRIIKRWMNGGDLPGEELASQLGLNIDALNTRMIRIRKGRGHAAIHD
jgi:hypothetical protein